MVVLGSHHDPLVSRNAFPEPLRHQHLSGGRQPSKARGCFPSQTSDSNANARLDRQSLCPLHQASRSGCHGHVPSPLPGTVLGPAAQRPLPLPAPGPSRALAALTHPASPPPTQALRGHLAGVLLGAEAPCRTAWRRCGGGGNVSWGRRGCAGRCEPSQVRGTRPAGACPGPRCRRSSQGASRP